MVKSFLKKYRITLIQICFISAFPLLISTGGLKLLSHGFTAYKAAYIILAVIRALLIIDLMKQLLTYFHRHYIKHKQPEKQTNKKLIIITLLCIFLTGEIVFMFVPQSQDVYRFGLANYTWNLYYKQPDNEKGFRDLPLAGRFSSKKENVFFLGDSFTYGHGIKHNKDRFSDIVRDCTLVKNSEVFNLGKGNSDTGDEYQKLVNFGAIPDVLILQYYHNDIEKTGLKYGHFAMNSMGYGKKKESKIKKIAMGICLLPARLSFFINYVAFNSVKFLPLSNHNKYKECIKASYNDTLCLNAHKQDLQHIIDYSKLHHIKLYVLFIPDLRDIEFTQDSCFSKITPLLKANQVDYIMVDQLFKKYKTGELVVNSLNAHTNELAHQLIAKELMRSVSEFK